MPSNVLVTGAAGFLGSHVTAFYAERDVDVTALDTPAQTDANSNWPYLEETHPTIEFVEADLHDLDSLESIVDGHDAIVHTAGRDAGATPQSDLSTTAGATLNVLEAARAADSDPAVLYTSSSQVYGDSVETIARREDESRYWFDVPIYDHGIPESQSIDGCAHTPHGVATVAADLYVQDYAQRGLLEAAVFRLSCVYGPRQSDPTEGWLTPVVYAACHDEPVSIVGEGKRTRDVLHVADLARAIDAYLADPADQPTIFNVGGGLPNAISQLELLELIEAEMGGRPETETVEPDEADRTIYISDIKRARRELGWEPEADVEAGVEELVEWYGAD